ncbi:death-associated protein kinase 2 [Austrofundulus limnaeus]|uniref:non-specific serine/threonine protein kinase n=1 Tax=Austrofundulus limnaeus TaxID=52670 RepID=A0A2I4CTI7_AUSLI|nr:PREDICTED: death-associated protein kinase 2-like [Austrofundulus limnaeus]
MAVFKPENVEDLYEIEEVLGSGHFGQVRKVREKTSGTCWAGKFLKIRKSACSRLGLERSSVEREVEILQALKHPNIVNLKDVFESRSEVVLILEFVSGGELFDFIAQKENLLESEAIQFIKQILEGLRFMHSNNIAHFDLKPENIMLSDKVSPRPIIKLIDFGLAYHFSPGEEYRSTSGTPQYIAPEVINCEPLSTATDMWSIGVITYILLSGLSPFQGDTDEETLKNILALKYEFDKHYFSTTSAMAKDFILKLLVNNSNERMTAEECLLHPWIKPITRTQAVSRHRSSINIRSFKKFNAKRKWKMSYNMVRMCNQLVSLRLHCKSSSKQDPLERECESDVEDADSKPASLLRRRLSSSS